GAGAVGSNPANPTMETPADRCRPRSRKPLGRKPVGVRLAPSPPVPNNGRHWTLNQDLVAHDSAVASTAGWAGRLDGGRVPLLLPLAQWTEHPPPKWTVRVRLPGGRQNDCRSRLMAGLLALTQD